MAAWRGAETCGQRPKRARADASSQVGHSDHRAGPKPSTVRGLWNRNPPRSGVSSFGSRRLPFGSCFEAAWRISSFEFALGGGSVV